jgi:CheY-like chemotaxis protein
MNLESLLISHDAALLGVLRPTLEKLAVSVEVCANSESGNETLSQRKFDAVIVDCDDLQGGIDIIKGLRKAQSNGSSVAFAVLNGKTTTQEAFQIGANFVLQKPLTPLHATRCFNAALSFMVRERRRYFRQPVAVPVQMSADDKPVVHATTTNLSEGGMAIRFTGKLPKDAVVGLQFTLPNSITPLELKAKIAWADESGHAGVKFVEVPSSSQVEIDEWLSEQLKEDMPDNLKELVDLQ